MVVSAVGAYLHVLWNIGGFLTTLASLGSLIWLLSTPPFEEVYESAFVEALCLFRGFVIWLILTVFVFVIYGSKRG